MSKAVTKTTAAQDAAVIVNPFKKRETTAMNSGTVAIEEQRATTEALGMLYLAKQFPRDEAAAYEKVIESCKRAAFAESAEFSYPRGGENVSGPSIRLAEELARAWGNIEFGIRELSDDDDSTEVEAFAWDLQTNLRTSKKFKVKKERSTKNGRYKLSDQRDIYELNANMGARRLRSCIMAVLPPDLIDGALAQCRLTLKPPTNELPGRLGKMVKQFEAIKVTAEMIEARMGKKIKDLSADDFTTLIGIFNSIKAEQSRVTDWFGGEQEGSTPITEGAAGDFNSTMEQD